MTAFSQTRPNTHTHVMNQELYAEQTSLLDFSQMKHLEMLIYYITY
jgi:hypothetical protein